jgi:hypothetical protein
VRTRLEPTVGRVGSVVVRGRGSVSGTSTRGRGGRWVDGGVVQRYIVSRWTVAGWTEVRGVSWLIPRSSLLLQLLLLLLLLQVHGMFVGQRAPFTFHGVEHLFLESDRALSITLLLLSVGYVSAASGGRFSRAKRADVRVWVLLLMLLIRHVLTTEVEVEIVLMNILVRGVESILLDEPVRPVRVVPIVVLVRDASIPIPNAACTTVAVDVVVAIEIGRRGHAALREHGRCRKRQRGSSVDAAAVLLLMMIARDLRRVRGGMVWIHVFVESDRMSYLPSDEER